MLVTRIRPVLVAAAIGAAVLGMSTPAFAAPAQGKVVSVSHLGVDSYVYGEAAKSAAKYRAVGVIGLEVPPGATAKKVYCIDIETPLAQGKTYDEADWDTASNIPAGNLEKINWILHNSYPSKSGDEVRAKAGIEAAASVRGTMSAADYVVYAGTQAAIWHYSDGFNLASYPEATPPNYVKRFKGADYADVKKVYDYLVGVGVTPPAAQTLKITPTTANGTVGDKVGPFAVAGGVGDITLSATGGKAVDADGNAITKIENGGEFWLTSDAAGPVTVKATGIGITELGRVFVHARDKAQKIILPGEKRGELTGEATATFTAPETPTLPVTGAAATGIAAAGLLLLGIGGGLLLLRRRRNVFEA